MIISAPNVSHRRPYTSGMTKRRIVSAVIRKALLRPAGFASPQGTLYLSILPAKPLPPQRLQGELRVPHVFPLFPGVCQPMLIGLVGEMDNATVQGAVPAVLEMVKVDLAGGPAGAQAGPGNELRADGGRGAGRRRRRHRGRRSRPGRAGAGR